MSEDIKRQQTEMTWFLIPRRDEHYQWRWGYRKVKINILPESEKQKFLAKMKPQGES